MIEINVLYLSPRELTRVYLLGSFILRRMVSRDKVRTETTYVYTHGHTEPLRSSTKEVPHYETRLTSSLLDVHMEHTVQKVGLPSGPQGVPIGVTPLLRIHTNDTVQQIRLRPGVRRARVGVSHSMGRRFCSKESTTRKHTDVGWTTNFPTPQDRVDKVRNHGTIYGRHKVHRFGSNLVKKTTIGPSKVNNRKKKNEKCT